MRTRVLGPMRVRRHRDRWEPIGSSQQRTLLAALLVSDGRISTERLIEELWPERCPKDPANGVQVLIGRLRRTLDDNNGDLLRTSRPGYHLRLEPGDTDSDEFETRVREGFAAVHDGARTTGNRADERSPLAGLGHVHRLLGRHEQAADHFGQALQIARTTGNRRGELAALTSLGQIHRMQARYEQAADHCQQLLDLARKAGDRNFEFEAWQGLGRLRHATGHPEAAIAHHERALAPAGDLGQPDDQARANDGLAHAYQALHQPERAHTHWRQALAILERLDVDHTDDEETTAAAIRAHLT